MFFIQKKTALLKYNKTLKKVSHFQKLAFFGITSDLHVKTNSNKNSLEVPGTPEETRPSRSRSRDLSNDMRIAQPLRSSTFKTRRAQTARQRSSFFSNSSQVALSGTKHS